MRSLQICVLLAMGAFILIEKGKTAYLTDKEKLWDGGIIPFAFKEFKFMEDGQMVSEPLFRDQDKKLFREAMQHIESQVPCLSFR